MTDERIPMNVAEGYPLIDTLQIRSNASELEGFPGYSSLAGEEQIPFFTKRTRANVGLAYCNKDSQDALPFVYHIKSIGLEFQAPPDRAAIPKGEGGAPTAEDLAEYEAAYLFEKILPGHVGVILKIKEDERLATTAIMVPPGYGALGTDAGGDLSAPVHALTNSWPQLTNRFWFPKPLAVPRQSIVTVSLLFSKWAKGLLKLLPGPTNYALYDMDAKAEKDYPRCAMIRCSLIGVREVQQRDELHY